MTETRAEYQVSGQPAAPRQETLLPYAHGYSPPTPEEIRTVLRLTGLTGAAAADLVGVTGRTVRKWVGAEREIPYSAWRLLTVYAGLTGPEVKNR